MRIGSWVAVAAGVALGAGCTSVKMVQRDGCWIRQTEKFPKRISEEVGPCAKPEPRWADDRITRIVQECVAHEDYRWQTHALEAFSKNQPIPEPRPEGEVLQGCMNQAAASMVSENDALKNRLTELAEDRAQYKRIAEEDRVFFKEHTEKMATALGEAAKRPAPSAVATATSSGTASTQSSQSSEAVQSEQSSHESRTRTTPAQRAPTAGPNPALTVAPRTATPRAVAPKTAADEVEARVADRAHPAEPACEPWWSGIGGSGPAPTIAPAIAPVTTGTPATK